MSWYDLLLFGHIVAAILWLGAGFFIQLLAMRAERAHDGVRLKQITDDAAAMGQTYFMPSALVVLVLGILLVIDGPWAFDQLWVVLGLAGFAATFVMGAFVAGPRTERIAAIIERDGFGPEAQLETRKLLTIGRIDLTVLYLVVAVMALKPTADDVAVLLVMAAIVIGAATWVTLRLRALDAEGASAASAVA